MFPLARLKQELWDSNCIADNVRLGIHFVAEHTVEMNGQSLTQWSKVRTSLKEEATSTSTSTSTSTVLVLVLLVLVLVLVLY